MSDVSLAEFGRDLPGWLDRVTDSRDPLTVTRPDAEPVVVVPESTWSGLQETLFLLSSPVNAQRLLESIAQANAGLCVEHDLIEVEGDSVDLDR